MHGRKSELPCTKEWLRLRGIWNQCPVSEPNLLVCIYLHSPHVKQVTVKWLKSSINAYIWMEIWTRSRSWRTTTSFCETAKLNNLCIFSAESSQFIILELNSNLTISFFEMKYLREIVVFELLVYFILYCVWYIFILVVYFKWFADTEERRRIHELSKFQNVNQSHVLFIG